MPRLSRQRSSLVVPAILSKRFIGRDTENSYPQSYSQLLLNTSRFASHGVQKLFLSRIISSRSSSGPAALIRRTREYQFSEPSGAKFRVTRDSGNISVPLDVLDIDDVIGKRIIETRLHGNLTVREPRIAPRLQQVSLDLLLRKRRLISLLRHPQFVLPRGL